MFKPNKLQSDILDLIDAQGITIVSYNLAPNAFGFYYEISNDTEEWATDELDAMLQRLSNTEESQLCLLITGLAVGA